MFASAARGEPCHRKKGQEHGKRGSPYYSQIASNIAEWLEEHSGGKVP